MSVKIFTLPPRPWRRPLLALATLVSLLAAGPGHAQSQYYDPLLKPFYHGVASGDPMADRVILWTRVTPETEGSITVTWKVATDAALTRVVRNGVATTSAEVDYTVKLDVADLQPATTYYYSFSALGKNSLIGRTKTAPLGDVSHLRFAVVSCTNFEAGYFNSYGNVADRNDLDAVIHLGDYIYEYGPRVYGDRGLAMDGQRVTFPANEIVTLTDYRQRYGNYRLDADLRRAHQQHPFIPVWDDHESANNSYKDGAQNHQPATEGDWQVRKEVARRVYDEWMPIRVKASPLYRLKPYGNLVDLIMVDTRLEGREVQIEDVTSPALYDSNRTILGDTQREWLFDQLKNSTAKWKIIGNQVIFSEFNIGWAATGTNTFQSLESSFLDIWDGYPAERQKVTDFIAQNKINNTIILTGDIHTSFAFDVAPRPSVFSPGGPAYNPATGAGSVAVELVTPSITSANFDEAIGAAAAAAFEFQFNKPLPATAGPLAGVNPNPHMKYVDLDRNGYFILDLTPEKAQADWYFTETILKPTKQEKFDAGFYTLDGENHLRPAPAATLAKAEAPAPAPGLPNPLGTAQGLDIQLLGTYATGVFNGGTAEIPAYDPLTKRLFVTNAIGTVDVLSIDNPAQPTKLFSIDIKAITGGTPNSVAVKNGIVAVAVEKEDADENYLPGLVAFFASDLAAAPTEASATVAVGALPDMLTFTPDGKKVLVANEGQPGETLDPEGSVSIIDLSSGLVGATGTTVRFTDYDGKENELRAKGVRVFPGKQASLDFEPEYIAVAPDGKTAFVTLQEANAFAVLDIASATFRDVLPLGYKDHRRGPATLKQYNFNEPAIGQKRNGDPLRFGGLSSLFFEKEAGGKYTFVTVPDRGPNGEETPAGRPFLKPDYVAEVIRFQLDKASGEISILEKIPLTRNDGGEIKAITGFPNIAGVDEKPIDEDGNALPYDPFGADLEGIVVAPDGSFWMVDEYRPAVYHFNAAGLLLNRFVPKGTAALAGQPEGTYGDETLPADYAKRRANRGFEAVALDSSGILYAFIQTPLANPNRATSDNSNLIRVLGIDPANGEPVAEYVYALEKPRVRVTNVDKIGDATYDPKTGSFYVIERDDEANPTNKKFIFRFDLKGATNLLAPGAPALASGKTLEQHSLDELAALGIKSVKKTKILNLPSIGYLPGDKPEGLALLPDGSLAVLNDNDFGVNGPALSTVGLGIISFEEGNKFDASDRDNAANLRNWPVKGMYMPDAVTALEVAGQTYYITANEGDARDENARVGSLTLDPTAFPNGAALKAVDQLGRLNVSEIDGDVDGDGDYDELYAYGARSFSVWDSYGNLVFDSGDDLERITAAKYPNFFNSTNDANTFDARSDDKGPEPEGVTTGIIDGRPYAFVGLERIGGFVVYDVSTPEKPRFVEYVNNRNFAGNPRAGTAGDLGPEGLVFIAGEDSPTGQALLVVSNEISGTTSIFSVGKQPAVVGFTLVNAQTDGDIRPLTDGDTIDFAQLATVQLSVRANVNPDPVGSVVFELNGEVYRVENPEAFSAVYSLAGDTEGNYHPWTPAPGDYTLTATPYAERDGQGRAGVPLTIAFTVVNQPAVVRLDLMDATQKKVLAEIKDGAVIDLAALGITSGSNVNVRAQTSPPQVEKVVFGLDNNGSYVTENYLPYELFGTPGSVATDWKPLPGTYTVQATPYYLPNGTPTAGTPLAVTFTLVDPTGAGARAGAPERENGTNFSVSPNPVRDRLTLRFAEPVAGEVTVQVYDILGRKAHYESRITPKDQRTVEVNLAGLPKRLYLLKVRTQNTVKVVRLVKE